MLDLLVCSASQNNDAQDDETERGYRYGLDTPVVSKGKEMRAGAHEVGGASGGG